MGDSKAVRSMAGLVKDLGDSIGKEVKRGSYMDRKTAELWAAYTGFEFDPHTVKIMCELRGIVEDDAVTRSLMKEDNDD